MVPVEVTDRTLSDEERLRVWIYIHRQRKEWDAKEKEIVAYRLPKTTMTTRCPVCHPHPLSRCTVPPIHEP